MHKLDFYLVNDDYVSYLGKFDCKVINNKTILERKFDRKYIGIVFQIESFKYFAPLASFKEKHHSMKDSIDFIKIGEMAVINLNNMIPAIDSVIAHYEFEEEEDIKYRDLLRNEYKILKQKESVIIKNAQELYKKVTIYKSYIKKRCCDFKLLEEKCLEYNIYLGTLNEVAATMDENIHINIEDKWEPEI